MKAKLKKSLSAFKLKRGEVIEVKFIGIREDKKCPYVGQKMYKIESMNHWLPEEDLNII